MIVEPSPVKTHQMIRDARRRGMTIGCVPTMGALHDGHVSLIRRAKSECEFVVATIFVNPTQFGPNEDFSKYPRTLESDLQMCSDAGASLVFTPQTTDMYSPDAETIVRVTRLSTVLEGAHRPGHFDGVTTVVSKLFLITDPDKAYFGQKDFQQQLIIRRMVTDVNFPIEIVTCPIIREPDGLAMSSRNRYLSSEERRTAAQLYQALLLGEKLAKETQLEPAEISARMHQHLEAAGGIQVQYAILANTSSLEPLTSRGGHSQAVGLIAARVGTTRLIDNLIISL